MSSPNDNVLLNNSSEATREFFFYFYQTLNHLAPISRLDEDPVPSSMTLSSGAQTLMQDIFQEIRWFQERNQSSALQLGNVEKEMSNIQMAPNPSKPWTDWHQSLTLENIKEKIVVASQVYGQEGVARLSKLQEKIVQLHKNAILPVEEAINAKLISQDRKESHKENLQVGYNNVEVPVGEPADVVAACVSIGLAVLKPIIKVFCHKKARACGREITASQAEGQTDKATLEKLRKHNDGLKNANSALNHCRKAFEDLNGMMFNRLIKEGDIIGQGGLPLDEISLNLMKRDIGRTLITQHHLDMHYDQFLNEIENPDHGLIKNGFKTTEQSPTMLLVEDFHFKTKDISKLVRYFLSAKQIIREEHQNGFIKKSCKIAKELAEILDKVKEVFISWSRHKKQGTNDPVSLKMKKEAAAVTSNLTPFDREVRKCIAEIMQILGKKHDKSSSKRLQKWRKDGDRVLEGKEWEGRPLTTTSEASDIVQKLEDIVDIISKLSDEVMLPLTLSDGGGSGGLTGKGSQRELSQAVSQYTLDMISTMLSSESIELRDLSSTKE